MCPVWQHRLITLLLIYLYTVNFTKFRKGTYINNILLIGNNIIITYTQIVNIIIIHTFNNNIICNRMVLYTDENDFAMVGKTLTTNVLTTIVVVI